MGTIQRVIWDKISLLYF